jgi:hypothetical protein
MSWEVEYTDEFSDWWTVLNDDEQDAVAVVVTLLEQKGPMLPHPYSSGIVGSRHEHMRELRIQHKGSPYCVLCAFDPRRAAILLLGGNKTGKDRWYEETIPLADKLYDRHLAQLREEGLI